MAASYTWGVLAADVAGELVGIDDSAIGVATTPVATGNLTQWIDDGSAKFNAVLKKAGITPSASLDADAHSAVAAAVKMYAAHKAMLVMGVQSQALDEAKMEWLSVYTEYSNRPQQLGDAYVGGVTVASDTDTKADEWSFTNSEGNLW